MVSVLGRSNVGKSSLLNALLGVDIARVSATPGRTQGLYWYRVGEAFDVVDCPGYGFAKAARSDRELFTRLIEDLLASSPVPEVALLLIDGRLEPQEADRSMALFLQGTGAATIVAATKWDDVRPAGRVRRLGTLVAEYGDAARPILPVSARTGENLRPLAALLRERLFLPRADGAGSSPQE